ncbi:MAG: ABC transporter ATP-binding protein [Eubacteriales bacterium]
MKNKISRSDNYIPDYAYLFEDGGNVKRQKTRFLKKLLRMNIATIILSSLVYVLQSAPVYVTPLVTSDIIDLVGVAVSGENVTTRIIIDVVILFVAIMMNIPTTRLRWHMVSRMLRDTSAGIKCSVVRKLQSLSITYHKDMETGKLQSKFLKDTDSVDQLLNAIMMTIVPNIINAIIATSISVYKNGLVSLFFLVVIPCNVLLTLAFNKRIRRDYRELRKTTENMSSRLSGMLEMLPVTKSHGLENTEIAESERSIAQVKGSGLKVDRTTASFGAWSYVTNALLSGACLVFCSFLAIKGIISLGEIVLYQSMFSSLSSYITILANSLPQIGSGSEAFESISEIMNNHDVEYNTGKFTPKDIQGAVTFENVSYRYPDCNEDVIHDFSLDVKPGECVAFVGSSGSGKSTIMNLIVGFMKPTNGKFLIDGKDINEYNLSEYRHRISVVPQTSILFSGTIRENITYGLTRYSEEDLQRVLEEANVNEFLASFPNGVDTNVGEHGGKLSGGQKQRITIARALIRNPRILILDEATSALDNLSELHVQRAISTAAKGRTTFIVAHRLSTIRDADRIVVMKEGKMVECGTYDELMAAKGEFYKLKNLNEMRLNEAEQPI